MDVALGKLVLVTDEQQQYLYGTTIGAAVCSSTIYRVELTSRGEVNNHGTMVRLNVSSGGMLEKIFDFSSDDIFVSSIRY